MSRLSFLAVALVALLLVPCLALAGQRPTGSITVDKAWSRATAQGVDIGVGYLTIKNDSDTPDRLVSVSAAVAEKVEMHQTQMVDGTMQMRPVPDGIPIPAKGTVMLEPAGYHLMLMGLKAPLQKGSTFGASLDLRASGDGRRHLPRRGLGRRSAPGD